MGTKVVVKNARLSFPKLREAESYEQGGEPRYGATLLIKPGSDVDKEIKTAISTEAKEVFGKQAKAMMEQIRSLSGSMCYRPGTAPNKNGKVRDEWAEYMVLAANRPAKKGAPAVVDLDGRTPLTEESGKPYSGCYVNAAVEIWAQKGKYTGIRCTLIGIQFAGDGDAFAGSPASADAFEDLSDTGEDAFGEVEDETSTEEFTENTEEDNDFFI